MPYKDKEKRSAYRREYYQKNKESQREKIYRNRNERVRQGLCRYCLEKAIPGFLYCLKHIYTDRASSHRYSLSHREARARKSAERFQRLKAEGRCTDCGIPLIEGEGIRCVNCAAKNVGTLLSGGVMREFNYSNLAR